VKIRIPLRVALLWDRTHEWGYTPFYQRGPITIRKIDPIIAVSFISCVSYYYYLAGWLAAAQGAAMFIFVGLCALWFF
jgi:hypothetical protein